MYEYSSISSLLIKEGRYIKTRNIDKLARYTSKDECHVSFRVTKETKRFFILNSLDSRILSILT